jgi:hypothetical protein
MQLCVVCVTAHCSTGLQGSTGCTHSLHVLLTALTAVPCQLHHTHPISFSILAPRLAQIQASAHTFLTGLPPALGPPSSLPACALQLHRAWQCGPDRPCRHAATAVYRRRGG